MVTVPKALTAPYAWAPEVLEEAGVLPEQIVTLFADGKRAVPERPRLSLVGRKRGDLTKRYVWGPDLLFLCEVRG